eukprot:TRINITY_DN6041_c0_g1_i1.p1 TRINITY_DN6041_c0_g1~~TRINITY_DN6041_c0_g1_i1.p1  ORF type:complete len:360 (+),score=145.24 TRINITY_DN6041_c0_g1_i1:72-1082(+)
MPAAESADEQQLLFNAFQEAVRDGTPEQVLGAIAAEGFPANFRSPTGRRPLHLVAERGHTPALTALLDDLCAALFVVDNRGRSALHYAAKSGSVSAVELLLDRGMDAGGDLGAPLLPEDAAAQEQWDKGDPKGPYGRETPFHWAVFSSRLDVARLLLRRGGGEPQLIVDAWDADGEAVLHWACHHGRIGLVKQLVSEFGADAARPSAHGTAPLHLAAESGDTELVRYLVEEAGVSTDVADCHGDTPLHTAVEFESRDVVDYLLGRSDVRWDRANADGKTAEDIAAENRAGGGIPILLEAAREGRLGEARERLFSEMRERQQIQRAVQAAKRLTGEG